MGNRAKPRGLRILEGNRGKRPLPPESPLPRGIPDCPAILRGDARAEWYRLIKQLEIAGAMSPAFRSAMVLGCQAYGTACMASAMLIETGGHVIIEDGRQVRNKWGLVWEKAADYYHRFCCAFGLNPTTESKLGGKVQSGDDVFAEFEGKATG